MIKHNINPVAFEVFGLQVRWYGIAYLLGILMINYGLKVINKNRKLINEQNREDLVVALTAGIVFGGKIGYILFYDIGLLKENIFNLILINKPGMSFHGGLIGVVVAILLFCKKNNINFFSLIQQVAVFIPFGLFFGRIANFINGELYGRPCNFKFCIIFPDDPMSLSRHPSQLYEAFGEGVLLFLILFSIYKVNIKYKKKIPIASSFLLFYGIIRFFIEFFREPDIHIGYLKFGLTQGQVFSLLMILISIVLFYFEKKHYLHIDN